MRFIAVPNFHSCFLYPLQHTVEAYRFIPQDVVFPPSTTTAAVRQIPAKAAPDFIVNECQHLFHDGLLVVFYRVFQVSLYNLKNLDQMDATYVKFGENHPEADKDQKRDKAQSISFRIDYDAECGRMSHVDIMCYQYQDVLDHMRAHLNAFKLAAERREYHTVQFHLLPVFREFTDRMVADCKEMFNINLQLHFPPARLLVIDETNEIRSF